MKLMDIQMNFSRAVACLILQAHEMGYGVTLGHALRCENCPTGKTRSLHKSRLAIDLNLFKDGVYLSRTEDHRPLGEWWESQFKDMGAAWGGRFNDGNHYSFSYGGMK